MSGALAMVAVLAVTVGVLGWLVVAMVRSIQDNRTAGQGIWRQFGLGLILMILFVTAWAAQGITQWQTYTDDQRSHGEAVEVGDFVAEFGQSTMENWQSEFLQLFSFVVLAALYIHKGSAESKDSDDRVEEALHRIEEHLGTLPADPAASSSR